MSFLKKKQDKRSSIINEDDELNESFSKKVSFSKAFLNPIKHSQSGASILDSPKQELSSLTFLNYTVESGLPAIEPKKLSSLQKAVFDNDVKKILKLLLEKDRNADKLDSEHGFTSLFLAACLNYKDCAAALFDSSKTLNVNSLNTIRERTPLMMAIINENSAMVEYLLTKNADIDVEDAWKCTAVFYTLYNLETVILTKLIEFNPKLDCIDKSGQTVLHHACRIGRVDVAKILIDKGININITDQRKRTPLHASVKSACVISVKFLVHAGANLNEKDEDGETVVDYLVHVEGNKDIKATIENAIKRQNSNKNKPSPAFLTSSKKQVSTISEEGSGFISNVSLDLNEFTGSQMIVKYDTDIGNITKLLDLEKISSQKKDALILAANAKISTMEASLRMNAVEQEGSKDVISKNVVTIKELNDRQNELNESIKNLDSKLKDASANLLSTTTKHSGEITQLNMQLKESSAQHKKLIMEAANNIQSIEEKDIELKVLKKSLNESNVGSQTIASDLEVRLSRAEEHNVSLQTANQISAKKNEDQFMTLNELGQKLASAIESKDNAVKEVSKYKNQLSSISSDKAGTVSIMQLQLDEVTIERDGLLLETKTMKESINKLGIQILDEGIKTESIVLEQETILSNKNDEILELNAQLSIHQSDTHRLDNESSVKSVEIQSLKEELSALDSKVSELSSILTINETLMSDSKIKIMHLTEYKIKAENMHHELISKGDPSSALVILEKKHHEMTSKLHLTEDSLSEINLLHNRLKFDLKHTHELLSLETTKNTTLEANRIELSAKANKLNHLERVIPDKYQDVLDIIQDESISVTLKSHELSSYIQFFVEVADFLVEKLRILKIELDDSKFHIETQIKISAQKLKYIETDCIAYKQEKEAAVKELTEQTLANVFLKTGMEETRRLVATSDREIQNVRDEYDQEIWKLQENVDKKRNEISDLKLKAQASNKLSSDYERDLKEDYDTQLAKIQKVFDDQKLKFNQLEETERTGHATLVENYETHIKILSIEVGNLRLQNFKQTMEKNERTWDRAE